MASFIAARSRRCGSKGDVSSIRIRCKHGRTVGEEHSTPEFDRAEKCEALLKISLNKTKFYQFQRFLNTFNCDNALSFCVFVDIYRREEIQPSQTEADFTADTRAKARAIYDTFCSKGSPFSVSFFDEAEVERIERKLMSTVGNSHLSRNLFTKLQSRCLVELETTLFQSYISSDYCRDHSTKEAIQIVSCPTLEQVLNDKDGKFCFNRRKNRKHKAASSPQVLARDHFLKYLAGETGSTAAKAKLQVKAYEKIANVLLLPQKELDRAGRHLLQKFFGKGREFEVAFDVRFPFTKLSSEIQEHMRTVDRDLKRVLQKLCALAISEIRDKFFADFVESPYYLYAIASLSGVGYEKLIDAITRLGVKVASRRSERRKVFSQQVESYSPVQKVQRRRSTSATLFSPRTSTVFSKHSPKRYTLKRAARVSIAPELSQETVYRLVKLHTTPRDWKHVADRVRSKTYPSSPYESFKPPADMPFIVFGLEGVLANKSCLESFFGFCKRNGEYCCGSEIVQLVQDIREARRTRHKKMKDLRSAAKKLCTRGVLGRESWFQALGQRTITRASKADILRGFDCIEECCVDNVMSILPRYLCFQNLNRVFHYAVNL